MTVIDVCRLCRFSVLGFTLLLPLIGAAAVSPSLAGAQLAALAAVAVAVHIFGYVSNDLFDLAIDRTQPLRAGSPLVRGVVSPRVALAVALIPLLLAAVVNVLAGFPAVASAVLVAGIALGLAYNAWGKRIRVPLLSDALQGLAWVAFALYGALATNEPLNTAAGWLAATIFTYVLLINGLHGGLRDMANDARHGARTTALFLGARADADGRLIVPRTVIVYGFALQLLLLLFAVACMIGRPVLVAAIVAGHAMLLWIGRATLRATANPPELIRGGMLHLFLSIGVVCLPFAFLTNRFAASVIVASYAVPLLILTLRLTLHAARTRVAAMLFVLAVCPIERAAAQETAQVVPRDEIVRAMKIEHEKPYDLETANAARFNAGVILELARSRRTAPFVITHEDYFQAFVAVTGIPPQAVPVFIREAHKAREDQYVDARQGKVIAAIEGGTALAVNVVGGWSGPPQSYTYEDWKGKPALRTTHQRITSYRLLDLGGDLILFDEIQGVSGRVLNGFLALIFSAFGDAQAVRSYLAFSPDGTQVVRATGKKGFTRSVFATVSPGGVGMPDVPDERLPLKRRIEKAVDDVHVRYVPIRSADALRWRRVSAP